VADNGSQDGSQAIAASMGVRIVHVQAKGYGNALMGGIAAARGKYVIMGDGDDSYDFTSLGPPSSQNYVKATTWSWGIGLKAALHQGQCQSCISISAIQS
jgi:glycosyltransferase involved in cell wall biosynthesis